VFTFPRRLAGAIVHPSSLAPLFVPRARSMSIDGAESEEDAHELSFYALRSVPPRSSTSHPRLSPALACTFRMWPPGEEHD
jgi:hypothetical protein